MKLRESTGTNIIGYLDEDGNYKVNPSPGTILKPNTKFIILGSRSQINSLRQFLEDNR